MVSKTHTGCESSPRPHMTQHRWGPPSSGQPHMTQNRWGPPSSRQPHMRSDLICDDSSPHLKWGPPSSEMRSTLIFEIGKNTVKNRVLDEVMTHHLILNDPQPHLKWGPPSYDLTRDLIGYDSSPHLIWPPTSSILKMHFPFPRWHGQGQWWPYQQGGRVLKISSWLHVYVSP